MSNSYQRTVSDGTLTYVDIGVDYLDRSEISAYLDGVLTAAWSWSGTSDKRILFPAPIPNGVEVMVKRNTDASQLRHELSGGAKFSTTTLDENFKQALHIAQEAAEANVNGDFFTEINLHGYRLRNVGPAVDDTDALTLAQYKADVLGAYAAKEAAEAAAEAAENAAGSADTLRSDLQASGGSASVGYDGGTMRDVADGAKCLQNYAALRAYTGRATSVRITAAGVAGQFERDDSDTTSADNGGTIIVDASGRRWKRQFVGAVSVQWFGVKGDGVTDDTAPLLLAAAWLKANGGVLDFGSLQCVCTASLDFRRATTAGIGKFMYMLRGDGAVIDFRTTGLTSGAAVRVGATDQANTNEFSKIVVRGISLIGPDSGAITASNERATTLTGWSFEYCLNLVLENLHSLWFYRGYKTQFCFPIDAKSVISQNCCVGLHVGSDCTTGVWNACGFRNGRFGILMQPDSNTGACYGQKFVAPNLEGNKVGATLDPLDGSGIGIWSVVFDNVYVEGVTLDAFRFSTAVNLADAGTIGANRTRDMHSLSWEGGTWSAGADWGTSNHDALRGPSPSSTAKPYSLWISIPVQDAGMSLSGCKDVTLIGEKDPVVGGSAVAVHALGGQSMVRFDGTGSVGTKTRRVSKNITTVEKNNTGEFTITFARPYASGTSYGAAGACHGGSGNYVEPHVTNAGSCVIRTYNDVGNLSDPTSDVSVFFWGSE